MPYTPSLDMLTIGPSMVVNSQPEVILNAAANWVFIYWKQSGTRTLNSMRLPVAGIAGTVTNILSWDLRNSDISGGVGSSITTGTATPASYTSQNITGLSQSLTDGNYYGVLIKNAAGTPASNYFSLLMPFTIPGRPGFGTSISYDSGTTWDDEWGYDPNIQLSFADSSRAGRPWSRSQNGFITTTSLYSNGSTVYGRAGVRFRPTGRFFLHRVNAGTRLVGTFASAGSLVARVYRGTTLVATSNSRKGSSSTGGNRYQSWYFSTPVLLEADADYVVSIEQETTSGGSSSHYWFLLGSTYGNYTATGTSDANNPWGMHTVYSSAYTLSAWTIGSDQVNMNLGISPAVKA